MSEKTVQLNNKAHIYLPTNKAFDFPSVELRTLSYQMTDRPPSHREVSA